MASLKLKVLEEYLQDLQVFENPKIGLEQYATSAHIAACMLHTIQSNFGDIEGKIVGDLGCGCGILTFGSAMLGAASCIGFDLDSDPLEIFHANKTDLGLENCDAVQCNVFTDLEDKWQGMFDTVIMNPPFGTRNKGADIEFVIKGLNLASTVYSLHKTSTRNHILKKASAWNVKCKVMAELNFDLPNTYKFHTKKSTDTKVDLIRFYKV